MSLSGERVLTLPCLGRPFRLGMLYDCRTDCIIPGMTLWNSKDLKLTEESMQSYQPSSSFELIAEDSLADKTFHLGVEASLALSFMSGMVSVSGSAKYLTDRKESKKTSRVTLQFTCTSHFKELSMEHLGKLKYNDVFKKDIATHVVTGVVYGADAFFVFDREIEGKEDYQEVHGDMQIAIKSIPNIQIDGKGSLDIKDKEVEESDKFHCKFYGDILLPENPTTFKGAVKVYQDLPDLIGITRGRPTNNKDLENPGAVDDEVVKVQHAPVQDADLMKHLKTVPKTVWLFPLAKLRSEGAAIVCEISTRLVGDSAKLLESLHDIQMRNNDLMKSKAFYNFQGIKHQLRQFKDLIAQYETYIMQQLSVILPEIRGGGMEEQKLADLFQSNYDSPFNYFHLVSYLDRKEREIKVLEKCLEFMGKAEKPEEKVAPHNCTTEKKAVKKLDQGITEKAENNVKKLDQGSTEKAENDEKKVAPHDQATEKEKTEKEDSPKAKTTEPEKSKLAPPKLNETTEKDKKEDKSSIEFAFQTGEMDSVIYSFDHEHVLSFEFANIEREDDFLGHMQSYLKTAKDAIPKQKRTKSAGYADIVKQKDIQESDEIMTLTSVEAKDDKFQQASNKTPGKGWYEDPKLIADMRNKVVQFKHFVRANTHSEKTCFALTDGSLKVQDGVKKGAMIHLYQGGMPKEYTPPGRPGKPLGKPQSSTSIFLEWAKPSYGENTVDYYVVFYCSVSLQSDVPPAEEWQSIKEIKVSSLVVKNLEISTQYVFQVQAVCAIGNSEKSEISEVIKTKSIDHFEEMAMKSTLICAGTPETYLYSPEKCIFEDEKLKIAKYEIGDLGKSLKPMKTILVVSLSPSSRQSVISTLFNHVFGITWQENTRFKLGMDKSKQIDPESETEWLKIFDIATQEESVNIPFNLRIVEMPVAGFKSETNFQQLIAAFTDFEIDHVNCIAVTSHICTKPVSDLDNADLTRILAIFGSNLKNAVCLIFNEGNPNGMIECFSDLLNSEKVFKIPHKTFMNPCSVEPKQETELSETFKENIEQFFEVLGSEDNYPKRSIEETLKVLNNEVFIQSAAIEIYSNPSIMSTKDDSPPSELQNRVNKSLHEVENFSMVDNDVQFLHHPLPFDLYINEIKPQQSEYLQMKKVLAECLMQYVKRLD